MPPGVLSVNQTLSLIKYYYCCLASCLASCNVRKPYHFYLPIYPSTHLFFPRKEYLQHCSQFASIWQNIITKFDMACLANLSPPPRESQEGNTQRSAAATRPRRTRVANQPSQPHSPARSFSSDKENQEAASDSSRLASAKSRAMPPPNLPTPTSAEPSSSRPSKRRRLSERDVPNASQVAHERELRQLGNIEFYDPDQDMDERRAVRKGIRDLSHELTGKKDCGG